MSTEQIAESVALFYKEGSSDKEYRLELRSVEGGMWMTLGFNGRRGSALKEQKKTPEPVDYATAKKKYDAVLREKTKEGYTTDTSGAIYQSLPGERTFSGFVPQLLNVIREPKNLEAALLDPNKVFQEKHDGERRPIRRGGEAKASVEGLNKEGLLSGLPMNLVNDVLSLNVHRLLMDGEAMGERYVAFDLLELDDEDLRQQPYKERLKRLEQLLEGKAFSGIECVYTARTTEEKRRLFESLKKHKAEGVVSKNSDAAYAPGRPASGGSQEKFKFTETCSVRVSAQHKTKRSVSIEGLEDDGITVVALGNVTIPANAEIPKVGAIVNVSYLYLYRGGSLFQAVYEKERDDQTLPDRLSQFKVKSEEAYRADAAEDVGAAVEEAPTPTRKKAKP